MTTEAGQLAVYVPFDREGGAAVTIRAVSPLADVRDRTARAWAVLIGLVAVSVGVSALVALRRARQLAAPFEQLAGAAHDLRAGGFALRIPATGVAEGDEVARALEAAARSAADRVDSAHALAEDASHQVRTPITAARLALESALAIPGSDLERAARTAVDQLDRASGALGEVLALRRDPSAQAPLGPAQAAVRAAVARWQGVLAATGRGCVLVDDGVTADARVADTVLGQILDILLDNSVKHGTGDVRVAAREIGDWLLVDVTDAGRRDSRRGRRLHPGGGSGHRPGSGPGPVAGRERGRPARAVRPRSDPVHPGPADRGDAMTTIWVIEDDDDLALPLVATLRSAGHEAYRQATIAQARAALDDSTPQPDLVLLDLGLPDGDGIGLCRLLRLGLPETVIVVLTARDGESDVVIALDAGADDYLLKPFRLVELLARIRAHLRRVPSQPAEVHSASGVTVDPAARRVAGQRTGACPAAQGVRAARGPGHARRAGRTTRGPHVPGLGRVLGRIDQDPGHAHLLAAREAGRRRGHRRAHHPARRRLPLRRPTANLTEGGAPPCSPSPGNGPPQHPWSQSRSPPS